MKLKPIYGWGWFQEPDTESVEVPEPFGIKVHSASETEIIGLVEAPHVFTGMEVRLNLRGEINGQKYWNVRLAKLGQGQITGFAEST